MERETGTQTRDCPTCGTALAVVQLKDGATTTVRCSTCYPSNETAATSAEDVEEVREYGFDKPAKSMKAAKAEESDDEDD
jgi:DNA-directed RNA polymerase subunit M/transcription elongation factor TFIIS